MPEPLTPIERRIYNFLIDHLKRETYQPSVRDICSEFGIRSTKTVTEHLGSLQRKGYLDRSPSRSRALRILGLDLSPHTYTIPLYGNSTENATGVLESSFDLDREIACSADCFLVEVNGSHLQEFDVRDGDMLLVEPTESVSAGQLAVVQEGDRVVLQEARDGAAVSVSRNDRHPGNGWEGDTRFLGIARGLLRKFR